MTTKIPYTLLANGTAGQLITWSAAGAAATVATGTAGQVLSSNGAGAAPTFGTASVAGGGTGNTTATAYAVQCGGTTSTGAHQSIASVGTAGQVLTSNGAGALPSMQSPSIVQNSQSAAYTTVLADAGKHLLHPSADTTARTFTIDSNANVAYPIGTAITFVNQNAAGVMTIAITSDTMRLAGAGTTGSRTLAANGVATALKLTSTEWIISGTGLT